MKKHLEVTQMFLDLIEQGHITPKAELTEELRFPGELPYIPTIATYGTPDAPVTVGIDEYAELGQRS